MSYVPLDVLIKRRIIEEESEKLTKFPDKRNFRTKMTVEESLEKTIIFEMTSFGVEDISRTLRIFKSVRSYQTLNVSLFLLSYFYFSDHNFNFGLVIQDFDNDFSNIVKEIYRRGLFGGRKFTPVELFKLRQDFILYLEIIYKSDISE